MYGCRNHALRFTHSQHSQSEAAHLAAGMCAVRRELPSASGSDVRLGQLLTQFLNRSACGPQTSTSPGVRSVPGRVPAPWIEELADGSLAMDLFILITKTMLPL
jgi:hypothetical protein